MEAEEIQSEFFKTLNRPNAWQGFRHLMIRLKKEDSEKVLDALLGIFFGSSDDHFRAQAAAGGLLWKLKPKYNRNLREDIRCSLETWDVSIEELPWYFAEVVGIDKVRNEVESLLNEALDEAPRQRAKTYLYWLSVGSPEKFRSDLNRTWSRNLGD